MQKIKMKIYNTLKSLLKKVEIENYVSNNSKCRIHESVKQEGVVLNGSIEIGKESNLRKSKLSGVVKLGEKCKGLR